MSLEKGKIYSYYNDNVYNVTYINEDGFFRSVALSLKDKVLSFKLGLWKDGTVDPGATIDMLFREEELDLIMEALLHMVKFNYETEEFVKRYEEKFKEQDGNT